MECKFWHRRIFKWDLSLGARLVHGIYSVHKAPALFYRALMVTHHPRCSSRRWFCTISAVTFILTKMYLQSCSAYLIVSTKNRPNSTYCIDSPFLRTSENENMTVSYSNYLPTPSPAMYCFLHSEVILPLDACTICNGKE